LMVVRKRKSSRSVREDDMDEKRQLAYPSDISVPWAYSMRTSVCMMETYRIAINLNAARDVASVPRPSLPSPGEPMPHQRTITNKRTRKR